MKQPTNLPYFLHGDTELSQVLGIKRDKLSQLRAKGMPFAANPDSPSGKPYIYVTKRVIEWYAEYNHIKL